jgi:hypothetical protein
VGGLDPGDLLGHAPAGRQAVLELLNVEIFDTLFEAQVLVERWRKHCNTEKTQFSLKRSLRFLR